MTTKKEPTAGLRKLLEEQLADIYFGEKQLVKALPKMAKNATSKDLRAAFEEHLQETIGHVERLEQVFGGMGLPAKGKTCPAILGMLQECNQLVESYGDDEALDVALIAGARKIEHYEIATYSSLAAWAEQLGLEEAAGLLQDNLEEEQAANDQLMEIGEEVMADAMVGEDEAEEELVESDARPSSKSKASANGTLASRKSSNGSAKRPVVIRKR